ncbi:major facilitator superfamily domain-containing protein [Aspergillus falconensis]
MVTVKSEAAPHAQDVSSKEDIFSSATSSLERGRVPEEPPTPVCNAHGIKRELAYASLISTALFYSLDGAIVANIRPSIVETLGESGKLPWIGLAIALGTIAILSLGKACGIFNAKWLSLSYVTGFEVGSALCGAAPNMNSMILGRVIQGVAGCGRCSDALTYISMIASEKERPLYLSGVVAMWRLGGCAGPHYRSAFAQSSATWRWAFHINLVEMPFLQKPKTQD